MSLLLLLTGYPQGGQGTPPEPEPEPEAATVAGGGPIGRVTTAPRRKRLGVYVDLRAGDDDDVALVLML